MRISFSRSSEVSTWLRCVCVDAASLLASTAAAAAKGISEADAPAVSQNGGPANKKTSASLPELEYREKGKDGKGGGDGKKQHNSSSSILPSAVDSKLQEMEYMENHINSKRLTPELGSTENLLLKEDNNSSSCSSSSSSCSKNYKNASSNAAGLNSSPRGHSATNGSVPSSAAPSAGKSDKKHKLAVGKGSSGGSHRDPTDNCIPNNQLSKPEALVR